MTEYQPFGSEHEHPNYETSNGSLGKGIEGRGKFVINLDMGNGITNSMIINCYYNPRLSCNIFSTSKSFKTLGIWHNAKENTLLTLDNDKVNSIGFKYLLVMSDMWGLCCRMFRGSCSFSMQTGDHAMSISLRCSLVFSVLYSFGEHPYSSGSYPSRLTSCHLCTRIKALKAMAHQLAAASYQKQLKRTMKYYINHLSVIDPSFTSTSTSIPFTDSSLSFGIFLLKI